MDNVEQPHLKGGDIIFRILKPKTTKLEQQNEQFQTYYESFAPQVKKQLSYLLGDAALAEDLTQDVFVKYMTHPVPLEYPGAWFSKVAANTAYNYLRGEKSRSTLPLVTDEVDLSASIADLFSIEDHLLRKEEVLKVRATLKSLPDQQRTCLILKFSGYTYDEIHQATGLPKNQIGQYIARGKDKFMSYYQKEADLHVL